MRRAPVLILLALLLAGCAQAPGPTAAGPDPAFVALREQVADSTLVRLETTKGTIDLIVYQALMPAHGGRFLELVETGFYDNTHIHRVVDDFVIQGGDPTGLGEGGSGETIPHEHHPLLPFGTGALGMARDQDPDSGDSQWFITERPVLRLSDPSSETAEQWGTFAMFGQVVRGMDVVRDIADEMQVPQTQRPLQPVLVQTARVVEEDWDPLLYPVAADPLDETSVVEQPLHNFVGHTFPLTVGATAQQVQVHFTGPGDAVQVALREVEPGVFEGEAALAPAGLWERVVVLDGIEYKTTFVVRHPPQE